MICLIVFLDWLNYLNLQRRLRKEQEKKLLYGLIPIEVSESTAPGEALFISADVFNHEGKIDPNKVVRITNLEEAEGYDTVQELFEDNYHDPKQALQHESRADNKTTVEEAED